jgi:hypothetical protein
MAQGNTLRHPGFLFTQGFPFSTLLMPARGILTTGRAIYFLAAAC